MFHVAAFYKFTPFKDLAALKSALDDCMARHKVKGSILLAHEGINGTIAAAPDNLVRALEDLKRIANVPDLEHKLSYATTMPFKRMKVRLKKEIVTIGDVQADPNTAVGTYVDPADWNALISDPNVVVIDTRNHYEVGIGTFERAIDPHTERFGEFPAFVRDALKVNKDTKIAMFCTGGIRCEKASSFMKHEGFENVFHLKGGILKYLEVVPPEESLWKGACFVFDERVAVEHGLKISTHTMCHGCLEPVSEAERNAAGYEEGVSCSKCVASLSPTQLASNRERQKQFVLAQKRGKRHLGPEE
jgi:UPF0176 protein